MQRIFSGFAHLTNSNEFSPLGPEGGTEVIPFSET
jgi:hypothetical protein